MSTHSLSKRTILEELPGRLELDVMGPVGVAEERRVVEVIVAAIVENGTRRSGHEAAARIEEVVV